MEQHPFVMLALTELNSHITNANPSGTLATLEKLSQYSFDQQIPLLFEFLSNDDWQFVKNVHLLLPDTRENYSLQVKQLALQMLISLGKYFPPLWNILAKENPLSLWVYKDLVEGDEDARFLALYFLSELLSVPLPSEELAILGYTLINYLIHLIIKRENSDAVQNIALECLIRASCQFDSSSFGENRVLELLYENEEKSELGQMLIFYLNRCPAIEMFFVTKMIFDILDNPALAENFFYNNDLKVLVDVTIRELNDLPTAIVDEPRRALLSILEGLISNTSYRKELYNIDQLLMALSQFTEYEDKIVREGSEKIRRACTAHKSWTQNH